MRAAVLEQFGAPLQVDEVDLAEPRVGEVLVRIGACGICHTDLLTASGEDPSGYVPTVLGHEGAGIVEAVGPGVAGLSPGDHVVTLFMPHCGECRHCRSGMTNLCLAGGEQRDRGLMPDGSTRLSRRGEPIRQFMGTSAFAEFTVMPEISLARIDPATPLEVGALFACGLTTGLGAAVRHAGVRAGSTCVVFGAGLVGLGAVMGCRIRRAERIVCVDLSDERLAVARHHGATHTLRGGPDVVEEILALGGGFGADFVFEATGRVEVMTQAVQCARVGWGRVTILGVAARGRTLDVIPRWLIEGRTITGAAFGGVRGRAELPELVGLYLKGEVDAESLISQRVALAGVNDGLDRLRRHEGTRTMIRFDE